MKLDMKMIKGLLGSKIYIINHKGGRSIKNKEIKKPSFIKLLKGSLMHSIGLKRFDGEIKTLNQIDKYKLLTKIEKENGYMDFSIGCYTNRGKKYFIKTLWADKNDYRFYFIINEWLISNLLFKVLKSNKSRIATPKPIKIIKLDNSISLVYEFIDGKLLSSFSTSYQIQIFFHIISELNKITRTLKKRDINSFPKRSIFFYIISLPYICLMAFFRTDRSLKLIFKVLLNTLKMSLSQKINIKLILAHRDLKPYNVIIKSREIFLVDSGKMALTLPGYDLAFLSLDPAYSLLTKSLEKKLKIITNKFLKSYIAIQFADSNASVGMGKRYLEFLKSEYSK